MKKRTIDDLALFGGTPIFSSVRPTSNCAQPDIENFFRYALTIYESRWFTNGGPLVLELEKRLSDVHQTAYCVTFCSGFMTLMLTMRALAIEGKDEVIMPSMTYRRMADIAAWIGLVPRFCDVDARSLGMTAQTVEPCINSNTALILGVHPIPHLCDINGLEQLAYRHGIPLLFDSVEAAWASHDGKMVGSFGKAEAFSLHVSKLLNGFEGGYLTTNDRELTEELRRARSFGLSGKDCVKGIGLNAKLNEIHAAMTLACLDDLENQIERNRTRHQAYHELLAPIEDLEMLPYVETEKRGYKNILVRLNDTWPLSRDRTLRILNAENFLAKPYYSPPLHAVATMYETRQCGDLNVTVKLSQNHMLLPCGDFMSVEDVGIAAALLTYLQEQGAEIGDRLGRERIR